MSKIQSVVLVGRMNVGKSTLFNRISEHVKSMVLDYPGVTRDVIRDTVTWRDRVFEIVDTGGISLRATKDTLLEKVRQAALHMVEQADIVVFVVDGAVGVVPEDTEIARILRKVAKRVIIAINKSDVNSAQEHLHEFSPLGQGVEVLISAQHGRNINELLDQIVDIMPLIEHMSEKEPVDYRVTLLGKPNVGKSSLMNAIVQEERSIVSPIAGTTREAVSEKVAFYKEHVLLTDTPGIRRKRCVEGELEPLMVKSAFGALKDSDIIVLLMDAHAGELADQELKLAFYAFTEKYKALILLLNKSDLADERTDQELEHEFEEYEFMLRKIPVLRISCKTGKNVGKVMPLIRKIWEKYNLKLSDAEINRLCISTLQKKPLRHRGENLQVHEVKQLSTAPMTIGMRVNEPTWFGDSQKAFFENLLRKEYDLVGVPIRFIIRREKLED